MENNYVLILHSANAAVNKTKKHMKKYGIKAVLFFFYALQVCIAIATILLTEDFYLDNLKIQHWWPILVLISLGNLTILLVLFFYKLFFRKFSYLLFFNILFQIALFVTQVFHLFLTLSSIGPNLNAN